MESVKPRPSTYALGIDLGKRVDPSAMSLTEHTAAGRYLVRHLERLPLGMGYNAQADRIGELFLRAVARLDAEQEEAESRADLFTEPYMRPPVARAYGRIQLFVDCTGVGTAVVDDILREHPDLEHAKIVGVLFGSSEHFTLKPGGKEASLGKAWLVSKLQALLAPPARVELPPIAEADALIEELRNYEVRRNESDGRLTAGAFKVGTHDDLATALALSCLPVKIYTACSESYF
jgi:hypothetical protein